MTDTRFFLTPMDEQMDIRITAEMGETVRVSEDRSMEIINQIARDYDIACSQ